MGGSSSQLRNMSLNARVDIPHASFSGTIQSVRVQCRAIQAKNVLGRSKEAQEKRPRILCVSSHGRATLRPPTDPLTRVDMVELGQNSMPHKPY